MCAVRVSPAAREIVAVSTNPRELSASPQLQSVDPLAPGLSGAFLPATWAAFPMARTARAVSPAAREIVPAPGAATSVTWQGCDCSRRTHYAPERCREVPLGLQGPLRAFLDMVKWKPNFEFSPLFLPGTLPGGPIRPPGASPGIFRHGQMEAQLRIFTLIFARKAAGRSN